MSQLLLTEVFPPRTGGSGRWLFEVYRRFPNGQVIVVADEHPGAKAFDQSHPLQIHRERLSFPSWGFFDRAGFQSYCSAFDRLRQIVRGERVTAIHCGKLLPEGWLAWMYHMRRGLPYWIFVHGEELALGHSSRQMAWMMRRVLRRASGIIANSHNTAGLLQQSWRVPARKVHVVHPGVDTHSFRPAQADPTFRRQMGWHDRSVLLTVGRLQKRKGHDMLIRALPEIRRHVPNVLYAIFGDGPELAALQSLVEREAVGDQVQFLGEASDDELRRCYQQCDLFVLPNREVDGDFEGFGMVLVEAQACGKPVVAGASGGTGETMNEPHTGKRVACETPQPLDRIVVELLSNDSLRAKMGQAGRQWVLDHFDWTAVSSHAAALLVSDEKAPITV